MKPRQIVTVLVIAVVGVVLGGLWGSQQDAGFETTHTVALNDVVRSSSQSGTRLVSFITAMQQSTTKQRAADASGLALSQFNGIFPSRVDDSMIIEVRAISDQADAGEAIDALIEATLLEVIESEQATEQVIVDTSADEVAQLVTERDAIHAASGTAPGSDLADRIERDQFQLAAAREQLANLPADETFWNARLPGEIEAYETRIDAIRPSLDRWIEIDEQLDNLDDSHGDAVRRLAELEPSDDIAMAGTAVTAGDPAQRSGRIAAGRWAALVGGLTLLAGLSVVGLESVLRSQPAPSSTRSDPASSASAS